MKLVIDIDKEDYEYIRENKAMYYTSTSKICEAIFDGVPLSEEFENIASSVSEYCEKHAIYDWGIIDLIREAKNDI